MVQLRCDRAGEEMLRAFWPTAAEGVILPAELRGLADGAQVGPPGVRRTLIMEHAGERLRVEATAVGKGRTQFHLWREMLPGVVESPAVVEEATSDGLTQRSARWRCWSPTGCAAARSPSGSPSRRRP